jgi:hypothetical protein
MSGGDFGKLKDSGCMKVGFSGGGAPKWRTLSHEQVKDILTKQFGLSPG